MTVHVSVRSISSHACGAGRSPGDGVRPQPHRFAGDGPGGRMIVQAQRVEVGVELSPDTFTLQPSGESGWTT